MLKIAKVELEKVSDADMHILIERGMRGGTSYISKKHSEANNEYCLNYVKINLKYILIILIWIIYTEMQRVNIYHMEF